MEQRQRIAVAIGLQTHVLKICPDHNQIFYDDDADPAVAFAVARELVRHHAPYVNEFHDDVQGLTELLSETIGGTPWLCPDCSARG